jgi:HEAT repeat protein
MRVSGLLALTLLLGVLAGTACAQVGPKKSKGPPGSKSKDTGDVSSKMTDPKRKFAGKTLAEWILELSNSDASKRTVAIMAIPYFGDDSQHAVPALLGRFSDYDVSPRVKAIMALRQVAVSPGDIPKVVDALSRKANYQYEPQVAVRYEAVRTLARFYEHAHSAIPNLLFAVQDRGSWEVRYHTMQILWRVGIDKKKGPDPRVVKALLASAQNSREVYQCRLEALQGLGAMGKPADQSLASQVIGVLSYATRSNNRPRALWGYVGLVALEPTTAERSLKAIAKYLKHEDMETRAQAAMALGVLGSKAKSQVPALLALLNDKEPLPVLYGACAALARIGDTRDDVINAMLKLLEHKEAHRVSASAQVLGQLKVNNPQIMAGLKKVLDRKEKEFDPFREVVRSAMDQITKGKN